MSYRPTKFTTGFTLVELLISLAITALVLTAVAVSFNASLMGYRENEDIFNTINDARQALIRMTTDLRTAEAVDPCSPINECALATAGGDNITYRYNSVSDELYLVTNGSDYLLCNNVTALTFEKDTAIENTITYVKSVLISMTIQNGNSQKTIAAAAVIRRNLR